LQHALCIDRLTMRVLLVEDERATARFLAKGLREHAYAVDVVHDGVAASERLADFDYDIVVLDVMLPRQSGLDVCRSIRAAGQHVAVLMLTARDGVDARIAGLDAGADDYLIKPFDFGELLARVRALIRRRSLPLAPDRVVVGPLTIDSRTRELFIGSQAVVLTAREFALLEYLSLRQGDVVSRREIARHVWDDSYDPLSNVIDVYIQRLRRKIDSPGQPSLIRAHRGEGYQLVDAAGSVG
jgi:two-component system, OmpR family, copper resistance phosphate regulon response regulator CusR